MHGIQTYGFQSHQPMKKTSNKIDPVNFIQTFKTYYVIPHILLGKFICLFPGTKKKIQDGKGFTTALRDKYIFVLNINL